MARKNRMSVPGAVYHVTTRIAHQAMLLADDLTKEKIFSLVYSCAAFSGVEVFACCIMDNHMHILLHVPRVPERFWTESGVEPDSYAFGMRPPECRDPMWPRPSKETAPPPRPGLGFMIEDEELLLRLAAIYGARKAKAIVDGWHRLEGMGCAERADAHRERLCRRMYNVSQYMKTLKESVTRIFNSPHGEFRHVGALWQGRFYSGIVEPRAAVLAIVAAYIAYNPVKAGIAGSPAAWRWSSFARAHGTDAAAMECRRMYERMLDCSWDEACARIEAIFADGLPDDLTAEALREMCSRHAREERDRELRRSHDGHEAAAADGAFPAGDGAAMGGDAMTRKKTSAKEMTDRSEEAGPEAPRVRASQAMHVTLNVFRGAFIGSVEFARSMLRLLPPGFPSQGVHSARLCSALVWEEPPRLVA